MKSIQIKPFSIIGIAIKTTNENAQSATDIAELWSKFLSKNLLAKIPNKVNNDIYSIYTDYEGDHTKPYTTILGCQVQQIDEVPEGMVSQTFAGGNYVQTTVEGDLMKGAVANHWFKIFDMGLARNFKADFEVYGEKAQDPSNASVDIFVGVQN